MATSPSDLFAISAAVLLVLSFLSRLPGSRAGVSTTLHSVGYVFSPSTVFLVMASFLCFFAAVYSVWPLPMNQKAGIWHYWTTAVAIAAFWVCFFLFAFRVSPDSILTPYGKAALLGQFGSMIVILLAQTIFVVNLIFAVGHFWHFSASR
jgi:hypothetical protein